MGKAFSEQANLHRVTSSGVALEELLGRQVDVLNTDYDFSQSQVRNLRVPAAVIALRENEFSANYSGVRSEEYDIAVSNPETDCLERLNATIEQLARDGFLKILKREFITGERGPVARRPLPNPQLGTLPLDGRRTGRGPLSGPANCFRSVQRQEFSQRTGTWVILTAKRMSISLTSITWGRISHSSGMVPVVQRRLSRQPLCCWRSVDCTWWWQPAHVGRIGGCDRGRPKKPIKVPDIFYFPDIDRGLAICYLYIQAVCSGIVRAIGDGKTANYDKQGKRF